MKTDAEIQTDVMEELARDPRVSHANIGVSVSDGIASLAGHVPSYGQRDAAEEAASRVFGVIAVVEGINVKLPASLIRDDEDIARAAAEAIKLNGLVPPGVALTVDHGCVTLRGDVEWPYQRDAAERCISHIDGVTWIQNNIQLRKKILPSDIKNKIERALKRAAEREARKIDVKVSDRKVTLSGTVRSWSELSAVKGVVKGAPGVTDVESHLNVIY